MAAPHRGAFLPLHSLLVLLLSLSSLLSQSAAQPVAAFTALPTPPWAPRILQGWAFNTAPLSYTLLNATTGVAPVGSIITWGGGDAVSYNDVYLSLDRGQSFQLIGGVGASGPSSANVTYTPSAHNVNNFAQDDTGACKAYDPYRNLFYVLDETYAWISTDALNWRAPTNTSEYVYRTSSQCLVLQNSALTILNGQSSGGTLYENDVWLTTNNATTFTLQTAAAPWSQRDSSRGTAMMTAAGTEVLYMMGGHAKVINDRSSEIWVSSDLGATWVLLTQAPWLGRDHFNVVQTSNNIIVLLGGKVDQLTTGGNHLGMNDVWASLDGGFTWGFCGYAPWPVRQDHTAAIDPSGYIYVSGGTSYNVSSLKGYYGTLQDVWRSSISYSNVASVTAACSISGQPMPVPATLGLSTFPVVLNSNRFTSAYAGVSASTTTSTTAPVSNATTTLTFCYTSSSSPVSPYGPWTIVVSGTLTVLATPAIPSAALASASVGGGRPAYTIVGANATRLQVNRDGSVSTAQLGLCVLGNQGSDNLVYGTAPYTDWNGFCLSVLSSTDAPVGTTGQWILYPNGFPAQQVEIYYDLPDQSYPNIYHSDQPFQPQLTVSTTAAQLTCTAPSTAPQVRPATSTYQYCYQAYGTYGGSAWQASIGGVFTTLSQPSLTGSSSIGLTAAQYGQYVLTATGTRLQQVGSNASTSNPIIGLSWLNTGGFDGDDAASDPYLLASQPHLSGSCPAPANASCFGGLVLYALNVFAFPNGVDTIDSAAYAKVNAIYLRPVGTSVYEVSGPVPTFSQLAVSPLQAGGSAAACPLITSQASAVTTDVSPLFSTAAVQAATQFNISFSYYLNGQGFNSSTNTPVSANGYWSVQTTGYFTVQAATGAVYSGAATASQYPSVFTVVGATGQRVYTDAIGRITTSAITGVAPVSYVYSAGSQQASALNNDNLIFASSTTVNGLGYGSWTTSANGLALLIQAPASAPLGNPGLPGFPTTARFNSILVTQLRSVATTVPNGAGLYEVGWGPLQIGNGLYAPASFTAEKGLTYAGYTQSVAVQLYPYGASAGTASFNPLPNQLVSTSTAYTPVGLCYIIYPDELAQNGNWTIAVSAVLYMSPQSFTVSYGTSTVAAGYVLRQAQLIYAISQLTRVYIDQYGAAHISTGAVLQGQGGDGGSDNLIYSSIVPGDSEGFLVDGDGFTYTLTGGGAVTPGDPTLAVGINFYSETNYREAAEPWHQDGEYGGAGTSFTLYPGQAQAPACVAAPFTPKAATSAASATLSFAFCYSIQGVQGWSVTATGVFTTSATTFSSFNSANQLLYYIGTSISGTRTYTPSAGATAQVSTISGLPGPGGDGLYNQKYYYQTNYRLDSGGWGYYVTPAAQVPGVTATSSVVRVYNNNASSSTGQWLEYGLPQLQGVSAANVSQSNFYIQAYTGSNSYATCTPTAATVSAAPTVATTTLTFCYTSSSSPVSPYGPWTIVVSGTLTVLATPAIPSAALASASVGGGRPAYTIVGANATRLQVNRDGSVSTAQLGLCVLGNQGSDNLVYGTAPYTDWNGFCLSVLSSTDAPVGTTGQWILYPNGFPAQQVEIYYDLPDQSYPNIYHSDQPFQPQLTVSTTAAQLTCTAPSTAPQVRPATSTYQYCYQAYGTYGGSAWQASIGGVFTTLSQPSLTGSSSIGLTAAQYGQYVLTATGTRLQQVGSNASTSNPIIGLSWLNTGGFDGDDAASDPYLLASQPHLSGSCPAPANASCFGGLVLYALNVFAFPNGVDTIDSAAYAKVNAIYLRPVGTSVYEVSGPVPTFSQLAVSPLQAGGSAAACPLITSQASAVTTDVSPLFSTAAVQAATQFNISFSYYLNGQGFNSSTNTPVSANGYWSVQTTGYFTVQAATGAVYSGAATASQYPSVFTVVGATGQRVYTDAIGRITTSAITGVAPVSYVYSAGSQQASALNNDNLIFASSTTVNGLGYGSWTTSANGLALLIQAPASAPLGNPGLPGFPTTARFNSILVTQLRSVATTVPNGAGLYEVGWGPLQIGNGLYAPASFTAEKGLTYAGYTQSVAVQLYPYGASAGTASFNPLPNQLVSTSTAYTPVGLCYIIYPDELAQNGNWTIAVSAVLYMSPQSFTVSYGTSTVAAGYVLRQAQLIYAISQLTRVYIDQYGAAHISTGAVLQGQGGDGGSDNLIYSSIVPGDSEGFLVDGDGFTYTLTGGGAVTPGDPTLAVGINFYSETNYREAAEPWHQDGEYGGAGTSFTLYPGQAQAPACVAAPFTPKAATSAASATLSFAFCYSIQGVQGWSVTATGVFTTSATTFSSFNSANQLLYYIGTSISGTRTYTPSAGATAQVSTISGLPGPGGDGLYNQKYYYQTNYRLDSGGWGYYVTPAAQVPGVTATSSVVRVYNNNASSSTGQWLEYGLPQLQGVSAANVSQSNFYIQAYTGSNSYATCTPTAATVSAAPTVATTTLTFCYTSSSSPVSPYGPWTIVVSGTLTVLATPAIPSAALASASVGGGRPAYTIVGANATRLQVNRDGSVSTAQLGLCVLGNQGSDNLVYGTAPYTDWNGFCLSVLSSTDAPVGTTGQWILYPNGFPAQQVEIYYDLPDQSYPNIYHSDQPFQPQLTVSTTAAQLTCTAPSTAPQVRPATSTYQYCYQAYGTYGGSAWQASIGGVFTTLSQPSLTGSSSIGLTAAQYGQYVLTATGTRLQQVGSNASTSNPIIGLSWLNTGGFDGDDAASDPYLLASQPHLSGSCPAPANASCFGGLVLYALNVFAFPNGVDTIDSAAYAKVNAIYLRPVGTSVYEVSGPVPTFSQLAVSPLQAGGSAAACPLITSQASAVTTDVSPLFSTAAVQAATQFNISFSYYLNGQGFNSSTNTPVSANGYWSVQTTGYFTVQAATGAVYSGAATASQYPSVFTVVGATGQRVYTDAIGRITTSAITGVAPVSYVYSAGSQQASALNNDNLIFASSTTVNGLGYGSWTTSANGLALLIQAPASAPLGNPGLPGFPTTARFNSILVTQLRSVATTVPNGAGLYEVGWGPLQIGNGLYAPASFTAEKGLTYAGYTQSVAVQLYPYGASAGTASFNPLPNQLVSTSTAYTPVGLCYIIYPDELAQNGNWTIAVSAVLYMSPQSFTVSYGTSTVAAGYVLRQAQLIYAISQLTRVYIDQYGAAHISTGAVLQGQGGDGGSDNLIYSSIVPGDSEGFLVDGDGFTYTLTGGGAVTPGDPTLAVGINFYSETNYREAAEPWHQDGEYGGAGTSFTLYPGQAQAPACVAAPFTPKAATSAASATLSFAFCYSIQGVQGWSVTATGVFTTSATTFSSFNSANQLLYYIGTSISGTRTYTPSAGATAQVSTISGLPGPGGDGLYNQKYYYQTNYRLDSGGWGYYVTPAAQVPGVTATSSVVRVYNNNASSSTGQWLEYGLPQLQGVSAANVSQSNFYIQAYNNGVYSTCTTTSATIAAVSSTGGGSLPVGPTTPTAVPATSTPGAAPTSTPAAAPTSTPAAAATSTPAAAATSTPAGPTQPASTASAGVTPPSSDSSSGLSSGSKAAIALGVLLGVTLLLLICLALAMCMRGKDYKTAGPTPAESSKVGVNGAHTNVSEVSVGSRVPVDRQEIELA